jgi:peptide deformylase
MPYTLVKKDHPTLHRTSQKVPLKKGLEIGRELLKFIDEWNKHKHKQMALGLAACQLGIDASVCYVKVNNLQQVFINPEIVNSSDVKIASKEGCLSYPGIIMDVQRYIWVEVMADNFKKSRIFGVDLTCVSGKPFEKAILEGVVVQHEIEHTLGITIVDKNKM